jgi:hypothetical protein
MGRKAKTVGHRTRRPIQGLEVDLGFRAGIFPIEYLVPATLSPGKHLYVRIRLRSEEEVLAPAELGGALHVHEALLYFLTRMAGVLLQKSEGSWGTYALRSLHARMRNPVQSGDSALCDVRVLKAFGGAIALEGRAFAETTLFVESEMYFGVFPQSGSPDAPTAGRRGRWSGG